MKWRAFVLFLTGSAVVYFVILFQDVSYPLPVWLKTTTTPSRQQQPISSSTEILLTRTNDYFYKTQIIFDTALKGNRGRLLGIGSSKLNVNGYISQSRRKNIVSNDNNDNDNDKDWESCFSHVLPGPISHFSASSNHNDRFAVLYHIIEDEHINYYARVYYLFEGKTEYKDLHLPGSTNINSFSFEDDTILYSRDPDQYRFRVIHLPKHLLTTPSIVDTTTDFKPIDLPLGQPGEPMRAYHQPKGTKKHVGILSKLYSSKNDIYRVFSLDVHQTKRTFYINATLVDGIISKDNNKFIEWKRRDHLNSSHDVFLDTTYEYMTFVDGAHFHQERSEIKLPPNKITSNGKTIVLPILANSFLTWDYTNNTDRLKSNKRYHKYLYKQDSDSFLPEIYFWMQDDVLSTDVVVGLKLNQDGTVLVVWTESNSIYIYKRGIDDKYHKGSPYEMDRKLEWILRMMIPPGEGQLGTKVPIGNALFWNESNVQYLSVIMKNGTVNTYLVDTVKEQDAAQVLATFLREKWDLWIAMSFVIALFVLNEILYHP